MPRVPDEPLRRVTLNLFEADCAWFEATYGQGWTTRIRQHIHSLVTSRSQYHRVIKTIGDLAE